MVRFMPDSQKATDEPPFQPHRERPAVFVFATQSDASRFRCAMHAQLLPHYLPCFLVQMCHAC